MLFFDSGQVAAPRHISSYLYLTLSILVVSFVFVNMGASGNVIFLLINRNDVSQR